MRKIISSCAIALMLSSSAALAAEKSGFFIGASGGLAKHKVSASASASINDVATVSASGISLGSTEFAYGLLAGYKKVSSSNLGLRAYINYEGNSYDLIGVNFDALYNFDTSNNKFTPGLFAGVNVGMIDYIDDYQLYAALQAGVRANFANENQSLELFVKIPFTKYEYDFATTATTATGATATVKVNMEIKQNFNIGIRYIYTF